MDLLQLTGCSATLPLVPRPQEGKVSGSRRFGRMLEPR